MESLTIYFILFFLNHRELKRFLKAQRKNENGMENDIRTLKTAIDSLGKYFFPNESYSNNGLKVQAICGVYCLAGFGKVSVNIYRILSVKAVDFGFHFSDKQMCKLG